MYECPKCGGDDLKVEAEMFVTAYIDGEGSVYDYKGGDMEFTGLFTCLDCRHTDHDFWKEEE